MFTGYPDNSMSDSVEGGAALAWRLLATLEGGSLVLVTSALLAYTASCRIARKQPCRRPIKTVLVTNTTNELGKLVARRLEAAGCVVSTVRGEITGPGARVDALVVVGAEPAPGLHGLADLVTRDVYDHLKLLEQASTRVSRGGCIAWACAGASSGNFSSPTAAFDNVLRASLHNVARASHCEPIWIGRSDGVERTADLLVSALMRDSLNEATGFSFRNAAMKVCVYLYRCMKTVT